jgi:5-methylcytosine-specific restriction endonuclease McrA
LLEKIKGKKFINRRFRRKFVDRNYNDPKYKKMRAIVRKRDDYQCQFPNCKCRNRYQLEVHHLLPWSLFPALRFDPKNAILLCKKHHKFITGKEEYYIKMFLQIIQSKDKK